MDIPSSHMGAIQSNVSRSMNCRLLRVDLHQSAPTLPGLCNHISGKRRHGHSFISPWYLRCCHPVLEKELEEELTSWASALRKGSSKEDVEGSVSAAQNVHKMQDVQPLLWNKNKSQWGREEKRRVEKRKEEKRREEKRNKDHRPMRLFWPSRWRLRELVE